jgi:uncharacterized protein YbjT (DUF2867 family)
MMNWRYKDMILTGAGKTGRALVKVLSKVESVYAFAHHGQDIPILKSLGAEKVIVGDMRDESAISHAIQGARSIYHICPNMSPDEVKIGKLMINSGREAGIAHFVYHSVLHPQTERMNHHWQKLRVEEMIFESGLPFTILQPAECKTCWQAEKALLKMACCVSYFCGLKIQFR